MNATRETTTREPFSDGRSRQRTAHRLLAGGAAVYGAGVMLVVAMAVPAVLAWAVLAAVVTLVALAALVGAGRISPTTAGRWRRGRARDEWAEYWEELMRRPVR